MSLEAIKASIQKLSKKRSSIEADEKKPEEQPVPQQMVVPTIKPP